MICPNCGKRFETKKKAGLQRKYCSDKCSSEWRYKKTKLSQKLALERARIIQKT
jgi:endogenous inhibitor of DNA gyrase (YacG/DUF329 family)